MRLIDRLIRRQRGWNAPSLFTLKWLDRAQRDRNEAWIRSLCADVYLGDGTSLCRVLGRFKMFVATDDYSVSAHLLMDGYWEMWLTEALANATTNGMVAIDVGANLGYFSLVMADMVGPTGRVHGFEPNEAIAARARKSATINGFAETLTVHSEALGDVDGAEFSLILPPSQLGGAYLTDVVDEPGPLAPTVTTRRMDSYPELLAADVVKIDVEGAEEQVIAGMEGIFAQGRPMIIFLEFVPMRHADPLGFLKGFARWGFALSYVDPAHGERPITCEAAAAGPQSEDVILVLRR